ncbi:four helix bundle protein [Wenyingzhuangia heitensis]|uniref:Four helix bundle protein n=1 Tax=Wenyingzhuangia heitensis TaxID=1487859 RepID=A0ABX0UC99_9FLAO|nr:four helix bundle protein [Wenyingzhuangia heitensis]NIJ46447.1 four helix bundle protein [Wenyingzhuangia heitensis]
MHKIENLKIWQKSIELSKRVYKITENLPQDEKYGLISQIKRSSVSVASNIAEGAGRNSNNEFLYFLGIANGSVYELQTQLILCHELNFIKQNKLTDIIGLCTEIQKMIYSFQSSLKSRI